MEFEAKNILNLPNVSNQQDILVAAKAMANSLADIAKKDRPFNEPREWRTVQSLVRLGLAPQFFDVGDQLQSMHGTLENPVIYTWDIIGFDYDIPCDENMNIKTTVGNGGEIIPAHSMTLQLHKCLTPPYSDGNKIHGWGQTNVNWIDAPVRQWLNSVEFDPLRGNGFLNNFDSDLLSVMSYSLKANHGKSGAGGGVNMYFHYATADLVTLPSVTECYGVNIIGNISDGALYSSNDINQIDGKIYYNWNKETNRITIASNPSSPKEEGLYEIKNYYDFYGPDRTLLAPVNGILTPSNDMDLNRVKEHSAGYTRTYLYLRSLALAYGYNANYIDNSTTSNVGGQITSTSTNGNIYGYTDAFAPIIVIA